MVKMVMVDAVKKVITVDALRVDGATKILSPRSMYTQLGLETQMSDDQDTNTLFNPSVVEIPQQSKSLVLPQVSARSNASLKVRHMHLAHVNWQTIDKMKTKDLVTG
ncbi:hypothetical protein JG688_00013711 [Phytophthora aleatoria]|uniref:GAG-pre-integrase domain-containing protein n=1 Tax=Phytophthora aleatoria TaxID=2496075 RepID=A0A8J5I957_9STRA|nr:hypothetical protein JG688_00013711 [Phytophthora aleatoria]